MIGLLLMAMYAGLVSVCVLVLFRKWGWLYWLQAHIPEWIFPSHCEFCFFYRVSVVYLLGYCGTIGFHMKHIPIVLILAMGSTVIACLINKQIN